MKLDPNNAVVALCSAGMMVDGDHEAALDLFWQAWAARSDDFEASVAAHFLARHQRHASERLHWNAIAIDHAHRIADDRSTLLYPSLYLNLADSLLELGHEAEARAAAELALDHHARLPSDGYADFVEMGVHRLLGRLTR